MRPNERATIRWLIQIEDDRDRAQLLNRGFSLIQAATQDKLIEVGEEDGLGLAILKLHERGLLHIDYALLESDQGPTVFRGHPSYHLQQVTAIHTLPGGRDWVREPVTPTTTFNIQGSQIGQLAGRDVNNTVTLVQFIEQLERAVDTADAAESVKDEARGLLGALKRAARAGAKVTRETGVELLAKILSDQLKLPPNG